jgi:hypothetical protein
MSVPKAAVDEDRLTPAAEYKVRRAGEASVVKAISEAH